MQERRGRLARAERSIIDLEKEIFIRITQLYTIFIRIDQRIYLILRTKSNRFLTIRPILHTLVFLSNDEAVNWLQDTKDLFVL